MVPGKRARPDVERNGVGKAAVNINFPEGTGMYPTG